MCISHIFECVFANHILHGTGQASVPSHCTLVDEDFRCWDGSHTHLALLFSKGPQLENKTFKRFLLATQTCFIVSVKQILP
jgi:hypothetical protein